MTSRAPLAVTIPQGWFLFFRDFQFRYGMTFLGYFWSVVQPIASALPLIMVGSQFNFGSDRGHVPYAVLSLVGMVFWRLFWDSVTLPIFLVQRSRTLLRRIPLDETALLWAAVFGALFNFIVNLVVLAIVFALTGVSLSLTAPLALAASGLLLVAGLAVGMPLVPLSAVYHDLRYGIGLLGHLLIWSAPILHEIPAAGRWRYINLYNPVTYLLNIPRDYLFYTSTTFSRTYWVVSVALTLVGFAVCFRYYRTTMRYSYESVV